MNEVILHFDDASFEELESLRRGWGYETIDEACAHLIEIGYKALEDQSDTSRPEPTENRIVMDNGTTVTWDPLPNDFGVRIDERAQHERDMQAAQNQAQFALVQQGVNPIVAQQFPTFRMADLITAVGTADANTAQTWNWDVVTDRNRGTATF